MKSTEQRDIYANALEQYRKDVPVEQWPRNSRKVSRSGLARVLQGMGYGSFDRKRFESSKCAPIIDEMDVAVGKWIDTQSDITPEQSRNRDQVDSKELKRLEREVQRLEKELRNANRREDKYRKRYMLLEAEVEAVRRQHDAFEEHCKSSLKTLHV